jgi:hypothetical protein
MVSSSPVCRDKRHVTLSSSWLSPCMVRKIEEGLLRGDGADMTLGNSNAVSKANRLFRAIADGG